MGATYKLFARERDFFFFLVLRLLFLARVLRFYKHVRHKLCHLYQQAMYITKLVRFTLRAIDTPKAIVSCNYVSYIVQILGLLRDYE